MDNLVAPLSVAFSGRFNHHIWWKTASGASLPDCGGTRAASIRFSTTYWSGLLIGFTKTRPPYMGVGLFIEIRTSERFVHRWSRLSTVLGGLSTDFVQSRARLILAPIPYMGGLYKPLSTVICSRISSRLSRKTSRACKRSGSAAASRPISAQTAFQSRVCSSA